MAFTHANNQKLKAHRANKNNKLGSHSGFKQGDFRYLAPLHNETASNTKPRPGMVKEKIWLFNKKDSWKRHLSIGYLVRSLDKKSLLKESAPKKHTIIHPYDYSERNGSAAVKDFPQFKELNSSSKMILDKIWGNRRRKSTLNKRSVDQQNRGLRQLNNPHIPHAHLNDTDHIEYPIWDPISRSNSNRYRPNFNPKERQSSSPERRSCDRQRSRSRSHFEENEDFKQFNPNERLHDISTNASNFGHSTSAAARTSSRFSSGGLLRNQSFSDRNPSDDEVSLVTRKSSRHSTFRRSPKFYQRSSPYRSLYRDDVYVDDRRYLDYQQSYLGSMAGRNRVKRISNYQPSVSGSQAVNFRQFRKVREVTSPSRIYKHSPNSNESQEAHHRQRGKMRHFSGKGLCAESRSV